MVVIGRPAFPCPMCGSPTTGSHTELGQYSILCARCLEQAADKSSFAEKWEIRSDDEKRQFHKKFGRLHEYRGSAGFYSVCAVRIQRMNNIVHILLTEPKDNTGTSVTNASELIATNIYRILFDGTENAPNPNDIQWYEFYEHAKSSLDRVRYFWVENERRYIEPEWTASPEDPFGITRSRIAGLGTPDP